MSYFHSLLLLLIVCLCEGVDRKLSSRNYCIAKNQTAKYVTKVTSKIATNDEYFGNTTGKALKDFNYECKCKNRFVKVKSCLTNDSRAVKLTKNVGKVLVPTKVTDNWLWKDNFDEGLKNWFANMDGSFN